VKTQLVVIGAGGFGRETLDVIEAINRSGATVAFEVLGVLDDAPNDVALKRLAARGVSYLGTISAWLACRPSADYVVGVGDPPTRRRLDEQLSAAGLYAATLVHPQAIIGSECLFGAGTVICAGVHVSTNVHLGRHVHLNPNATIGHDSLLEDFVSVNPCATISGDCLLETETYVGSSAVILQGLRTGRSSTVGAAACVVRDVPAHLTVVGVPAKTFISMKSPAGPRPRQW
jgi:sugar O-acyltransferase (sialic acid O-acetyltransferase NeuD family)